MGVGTFYLMVSQFIFLLSNYAIHFALGRYFGPAAYGAFGVVMSVYLILTAILTNGIPKATSKILSSNPQDQEAVMRTSYSLQLLLTLILGIGLVIFSKPLALILKDTSLTRYFFLTGLMILPFGLYSLQMSGFLNGLRKFKQQAWAGMIHDAFRLVLVMVLVAMGLKLTGLFSGYFLATIIGLAFSAYVLRRKGTLSSREAPKLRKEIINLAIPLTLIALGFTLMRNLTILFLKYLEVGNVQVGYYTAASTLSNVPFFIFSALSITLLPSISGSVASNLPELTRKYITLSLRYLLLLLLPVTALMAGTSGELITLFYSPVYAPAGPILAILLLSTFFLTVLTTLGSILIGSGDFQIKMKIVLGAIVPLALLNLFLIPKYGLVGAAVSSLIVSFLAAVLAAAVIYRKHQALLSWSSFFKIFSCSLLVFFVASQQTTSGAYLFFLYFLLGSGYFLLLWLFGEIRKEDLELLQRLIPERFKFN